MMKKKLINFDYDEPDHIAIINTGIDSAIKDYGRGAWQHIFSKLKCSGIRPWGSPAEQEYFISFVQSLERWKDKRPFHLEHRHPLCQWAICVAQARFLSRLGMTRSFGTAFDESQ